MSYFVHEAFIQYSGGWPGLELNTSKLIKSKLKTTTTTTEPVYCCSSKAKCSSDKKEKLGVQRFENEMKISSQFYFTSTDFGKWVEFAILKWLHNQMYSGIQKVTCWISVQRFQNLLSSIQQQTINFSNVNYHIYSKHTYDVINCPPS